MSQSIDFLASKVNEHRMAAAFHLRALAAFIDLQVPFPDAHLNADDAASLIRKLHTWANDVDVAPPRSIEPTQWGWKDHSERGTRS